MTTAQLIANYTPAVDIISFITCHILMFIIAKVLFFSNDRKFILLKRSLLFTTIASWFNIVFYIAIKNFNIPAVAVFAIRDIYHVSLLLSLYCFLTYMHHMIDLNRKQEVFLVYLTRIFFCICLILDLLSPFTKFGFHLRNGEWHDAIVSPFNAFYAYTYTLLLLMLIFYSKRLIRYVRICLGITGIVVAGIMIYQGIVDINTYSSFTYVLPVFVVMILLHSKPFDDKTGALDSTSFDSFIRQIRKKGISADYVILKLNINMLETLPNELGKVLNSFWHTSFRNALSFNLASDVYVLAIPRIKQNGNTEEKINKLISNELHIYHEQYNIPYKLIALLDFNFIENLTDILGISQYVLSIMEENTEVIIDEKQKNDFRTMKLVKENLADIEIKKNPDDPRICVFYQPVRNMKTGEFDTAEALMRLKLDDIGYVMPFMFISMAEEYGYINTLTKIIFNKVSRQILQLESEGISLKRISINVSAVDMRLDGFCEELIKIIKSNGLNISKIGIELTESQTDRDFQILKTKMKLLRDAGFSLYLDDVGTGYSNLDRIVQYDVDVVKFDRFFLLEAEKSKEVVKMMSHLSQAFRDLEYKLLFEGVETDAHEELCMNCGPDFIQGFKYSKPISFEEYREFLKKNQSEQH